MSSLLLDMLFGGANEPKPNKTYHKPQSEKKSKADRDYEEYQYRLKKKSFEAKNQADIMKLTLKSKGLI